MTEIFSFKLTDDFVSQYKDKQVPWGYRDAAGNSIGEITFVRTYSRLKPDGTKERWHEVCNRVINGIYSIQKNWAKQHKLPWNDNKAQTSAKEAFDRMFNLKWTPPGRGLWLMGTEVVMERNLGAGLQNCAFISTFDMTKADPGEPFAWAMDALMCGIGVGFDVRGSEKDFVIQDPKLGADVYIIPDTREGWAESVRMLINSYLVPKQMFIDFDYSKIRLYGEPIKGFGGVASGPEPLERMHKQIRKVFRPRAGEKIDSRLICDIMNLIGTCVVAGNVRRSAELALGSFEDKTFMNLKNAEVFPERNSYDPENPGWGWMSNNSVSVKVGDDYSKLFDLIRDNGEPGLIWLDTTRNYGRLVDGPDGKDWRVAGFNPSLIAGTKVYTTNGVFPIEQLEGKSFQVKNLNGKISNAECWLSGRNEQTLTICLEGGWSYGATPKHKWPVWSGSEWIKKTTAELLPGDFLPNLKSSGMFPDGSIGNRNDGFVIGWNLGDGWQTKRDGGMQIGFMVGTQEDRDSGIDVIITEYLHELGSLSTLENKDEINVNNEALRKVFKEFGVQHKTMGLPLRVWDSDVSDQFRIGLIDGLLSSDGTVEVSANRIRISQVSEKIIDDLGSLLGFFGIKTAKHYVRVGGAKFPNKIYDENTIFHRYVLSICGKNVETFAQLVALTRKDKQDKINNIITNIRPSRWTNRYSTDFVKVISVSTGSVADVWDISVFDDTHAFQLDHCITGNCAEQPLESREMCTLSEVHINNHDSVEDFQRTLKFAYLYGKTVTLASTHWPETNAVMQRNRRIGTSLTGIAQFADLHGLPVLKEWMKSGYETIDTYDKTYSEWLCVRESIRMTTVKPSGTVSILSGHSPGVHWTPGGKFFLRAIRFSTDDPLVQQFRNANYRVEDDVVSANTVVVYFPIESNHMRSEKDVSIFEKINLAAFAQRYWSDNGVSCTVSFDEAEAPLLLNALNMFDGQLKAISFLPMGNKTYPQMPYTQMTLEEYEAYGKQLGLVDLGVLYGDSPEATGERFCANDVCLI